MPGGLIENILHVHKTFSPHVGVGSLIDFNGMPQKVRPFRDGNTHRDKHVAVEAHPKGVVVGDVQPDTPAHPPEPLGVGLFVQPCAVLVAEDEFGLDAVFFVYSSDFF